MQTFNFKLKQLRTLGIILTCGALAVGCAGNSVKPLTQESEPVTTTPITTSEINATEEKSTQASAAVASEVATPPTEATTAAADKQPDNNSVASVQQPAQMAFYFGVNKTELDEQDKAVIKEHARFLKANPSLVLEINGHTDSKGSHKYNEYLSKQRAEAVATVLITEGITRSQLAINALADDKPLTDNKDPGKNRRVELQYDEMDMVGTK